MQISHILEVIIIEDQNFLSFQEFPKNLDTHFL